MAIDTDVERYADPQGFAREVNLPLLGVARVPPMPAGASVTALLQGSAVDAVGPIVDGLVETRRSLSLHTLLLAGFPHDPECFAAGLAIGREWSRRGLRIAVVDLDFWNPTVVRPIDQPGEGFVDVLEYGCSFGRVAWELVADRLWVVGPGSHPPDEDRIAEHADWPRASRVFSGQVDVALFVAPLLDRRGFTGKLSKRMDAVLLAASVERTARADLRDAFLELWGSDAPMIGCVGIEGPGAGAAADEGDAASVSDAPYEGDARRVPAIAGVSIAEVEAEATPVAASHAPALEEGAPPLEEDADDGMVETLERELRRDTVRARPRRGLGPAAIWIGVAAVIALAAAIFDLVRTSDLTSGNGAVQAPQPAGEEPIGTPPEAPVRSGLGGGTPAALPDVGTPASTPPAASATAGTKGTAPPAKGPDVATHEAQTPAATAPSATTPAATTPAVKPPAAERAAATKPGTAPPVTPGKAGDTSLPFRVHVASFRSETKVQGIVSDLKRKGLEAWYEPAGDLPGWYRVFVGRFRTEEDARAYASWLLDRKLVDRAHSYPITAR
ncbi:MAG: SPOR domain-containing protein [Hyphomicrobiales bacterium]